MTIETLILALMLDTMDFTQLNNPKLVTYKHQMQ